MKKEEMDKILDFVEIAYNGRGNIYKERQVWYETFGKKDAGLFEKATTELVRELKYPPTIHNVYSRYCAIEKEQAEEKRQQIFDIKEEDEIVGEKAFRIFIANFIRDVKEKNIDKTTAENWFRQFIQEREKFNDEEWKELNSLHLKELPDIKPKEQREPTQIVEESRIPKDAKRTWVYWDLYKCMGCYVKGLGYVATRPLTTLEREYYVEDKMSYNKFKYRQELDELKNMGFLKEAI